MQQPTSADNIMLTIAAHANSDGMATPTPQPHPMPCLMPFLPSWASETISGQEDLLGEAYNALLAVASRPEVCTDPNIRRLVDDWIATYLANTEEE